MFQQILTPVFGTLWGSALVAMIPLVTLFVLLGVFGIPAWKASLGGLALAILLAVFVWQMPAAQALSAAARGAAYGFIPILWILVNALWVYRLTVLTGWFSALGERIRAVSDDPRILAILVAFCFGGLLESLAGFGAPVAISIAMLIAAGMNPLKSALVSLLANTAPVAFGAMATPIVTLSGVSGIAIELLAQMAGRQTPLLALFVPLILVFIVDGVRGLKQTWPIAAVAGVAFAGCQFVVANFFAVEISSVVASVMTLGVVLSLLPFWSPAVPADLAETGPEPVGDPLIAGGDAPVIDRNKRSSANLAWMAVMPYVIIVAVFSLAQVPAVKGLVARTTTVSWAWPGLNVADAAGEALDTLFTLPVLGTGGTLLLISGIIVAIVYRVPITEVVKAYVYTVCELRPTIITVVAVLSLAYVMNFSGLTQSLGTALAATGGLFALLSPLIGWMGVAITGSDASSNALFGLLQSNTATQAGLEPVLMAATNSSAGVLAKMLSPQNLAVAAAAAGMAGEEGVLFRKLIGWSLGLLAIFTVYVLLQSTSVLGWTVPVV